MQSFTHSAKTYIVAGVSLILRLSLILNHAKHENTHFVNCRLIVYDSYCGSASFHKAVDLIHVCLCMFR